VKEQVEEDTDIDEFIEEESPFEDHPESLCPEGNRILLAAFSQPPHGYGWQSEVPADDCNFATLTADDFSYFQHPLVEADAVGYAESNLQFHFVVMHGIKVGKNKLEVFKEVGSWQMTVGKNTVIIMNRF